MVDVAANPKIHDALANLQKEHVVEKVNIKMPDIDLSKHMHEGKDVVSHTWQAARSKQLLPICRCWPTCLPCCAMLALVVPTLHP